MSEKTLGRGTVRSVTYYALGHAEIDLVDGGLWTVPNGAGDEARGAMGARRAIELVEPAGCRSATERFVRLVPVVVVRVRGPVNAIVRCAPGVWSLRFPSEVFPVCESNMREAARALADDAEVEIVSIDGGPDTVRRVS